MGDILEVLVEEESMQVFLEIFLPTILPKKFVLNTNCYIRPHNGKANLRKSIPRKVDAYRAYKNKRVHLLILHDQDSNDCKKLKKTLKDLVEKNKSDTQNLQYKIIIVCRELENWYFGDLDALKKVTGFTTDKLKNKSRFRNVESRFRNVESRFRNVDQIHVPGDTELQKLVQQYGKSNLAKKMAKYLCKDKNKSQSFQNLIKGLETLTNATK